MVTRRTFIKTSAIGSAGLFIPSYHGEAAQQKPEYFGFHPFIENNPGAVFIMKTNVSDKKDVESKLEAGWRFC